MHACAHACVSAHNSLLSHCLCVSLSTSFFFVGHPFLLPPHLPFFLLSFRFGVCGFSLLLCPSKASFSTAASPLSSTRSLAVLFFCFSSLGGLTIPVSAITRTPRSLSPPFCSLFVERFGHHKRRCPREWKEGKRSETTARE